MYGISRRALLVGLAAAAASYTVAGGKVISQEAPADATTYSLGWQPDLPSLEGEQKYELSFNSDLPEQVDLSTLSEMPPVYDQGQIGSCVANAVAGAIQFARRRQDKDSDFIPSRLYLYYYARAKLGPVINDQGSRISDAVAIAKDQGVCEEAYWEYDGSGSANSLFKSSAKAALEPSEECQERAFQYRVTECRAVQKTENNLKSLVAGGTPVIFGFTVYSNMFGVGGAVKTLEMPSSRDKLIGGHAVLLVGYDDETRMFRIRNSWGRRSHDRGYYNMSYDYVLSPLARDFWIVRDTFSIAPVAN